jgi:hypothetical protein
MPHVRRPAATGRLSKVKRCNSTYESKIVFAISEKTIACVRNYDMLIFERP